jgi:hypothetical protein
MNYLINDKKLTSILEDIDDFSKLFDDRIVELAHFQGFPHMQARHTFIYYRKLLWEIRDQLKDNVKETKETKEPK